MEQEDEPRTSGPSRQRLTARLTEPMSYHFKLNESLQDGVIRIAREQLDRLIGEVEDAGLDRHQTVHQVRKRCKKVRGVIRAVRPALGKAYQHENACFRNMARSLSYVRDAQSMLQCLDDLTDHFEAELRAGFAGGVREQLLERRRQVAEDEVELDQRLERCLATARDAYDRVGCWRLSDAGFGAVSGGAAQDLQARSQGHAEST